MYKKGDLELRRCGKMLSVYNDDIEWTDHFYDAREDEERLKKWAQLPHSCDSWIIGGVAQIDLMVEDLLLAKARLLR